jgi:hypothetical protein
MRCMSYSETAGSFVHFFKVQVDLVLNRVQNVIEFL